MKGIKSCLSVLLSVLLLINLFVFAYADNLNSCGDNAYWEYNEQTNTLTIGGSGAVTSTPWSSLNNIKSSLRSVEILDGITAIPDSAFYEYTVLAYVTVPESVESIGAIAFAYCPALHHINLENVDEIGDAAFFASGIFEVNTNAAIGNYAFSECDSLEAAILGPDVSYFGEEIFSKCSSLKRIEIKNTAPVFTFDAFTGCPSLKTICFGGSESTFSEALRYTNLTPDAKNGLLLADVYYNHIHDVSASVTVKGYLPATCTRDGYSGDIYYDPCGVFCSEGYVLESTGHKYSEWSNWYKIDNNTSERKRVCEKCGMIEFEHEEKETPLSFFDYLYNLFIRPIVDFFNFIFSVEG